jgi:hypothetical protein
VDEEVQLKLGNKIFFPFTFFSHFNGGGFCQVAKIRPKENKSSKV